MMKKISGIILTGILLHLSIVTQAQSYAESAMLFSRTKPGGSARIQGIGGAQIALGGDYSLALSNPAGLGMYNRSEFAFSPAYTTSSTTADYLGTSTKETKTGLNIPGIGFVFHIPKNKNGFIGGSLALTLTRTNDYNNITRYSGTNTNTSIIDYFLDDANGYTTEQFEEGAYQYNRPTGLAYYSYLIGPESTLDPQGADDVYFSDVDVLSFPFQQEEITTKGASNQWSISYGGNYDDKIFFGAGLGIATIRYESSKTFSEDFTDDPYLSYLDLFENLEIRGSGINATLGIIARPVDFLQLGFSFTTPTFYSLTETYSASMNTSWKNFDYFGDGSVILGDESVSTDIVTSDYNLTLPMKASFGAAYISKMGFLSADVEFTNPGNAKYSSNSDISYSGDNEAIDNTYKPVVNFRIGGEYRYQLMRVRAGYGLQSNTFKSNFGLDNKIQSFSGGLGIRTKSFYADLAVVVSTTDNLYVPYSFYSTDLVPPVAELAHRMTNAILTVGFIF